MKFVITLIFAATGATIGVTIGAKVGTWVDDHLTEEERRNLDWICNKLGLPTPEESNSNGNNWEEDVEASVANRPAAEQRIIREQIENWKNGVSTS